MRVTGKTKILGILGYPVEHSLSPTLHNAGFRALGLGWVYVPWAVPPNRLEAVVRGLAGAENFMGGNVTVPHKEAVVPFLDTLSPEAERLGAVNTIVRRNAKLEGHNTDGAGFLAALREQGFDPAGSRIVLIGAGGAAKAVAFALAGVGAQAISIVNRTPARAEELARGMARVFPGVRTMAYPLLTFTRVSFSTGGDLIVNCTSAGLRAEDHPPLDGEIFRDFAFAYDLIYNPPETRFLRTARAAGCRAANGTGMLLHQGTLAFELWTGRKAPVAAMRAALNGALFP